MYHPRFKGNHYEMGQKLGRIFKKNNARFPIFLDSFQRKFGKDSGKILKHYFPEVVAEIKGVTDIIGYDNELFTSWMMCMGCCLDIKEGNSAEIRGCTAFSFIHHGQVVYGRNNDLPPFLGPISKSIYYQPDLKNRFILNTSSFINGEEGINQYGLIAAMTFVMPKLEEIKPGLNSLFLVRYILENCKSVDQANEFLKNVPIASSCNILLADPNGKMNIVECNPYEIHIRKPERSDRGEDFIITVNNFTSDQMKKHDRSTGNVYFSEHRYKTAYDALKKLPYDNPIQFTKSLLSGDYGFICQYDKSLDFDTIWSSIFDSSNLKVYRAEGNPYKTKYIDDIRLKI